MWLIAQLAERAPVVERDPDAEEMVRAQLDPIMEDIIARLAGAKY